MYTYWDLGSCIPLFTVTVRFIHSFFDISIFDDLHCFARKAVSIDTRRFIERAGRFLGTSHTQINDVEA